MRPFFINVPCYVFKEFFYVHKGFFKETFKELLDKGVSNLDIDNVFLEWSDVSWNKEIIEVTINDFTQDTQLELNNRGLGSVHLDTVPEDYKRTLIQRELADKVISGSNEPVILLETKQGYNLLEGWHRTMSYLRKSNDKILINAWVGRGEWVDDL